MAGALLLQIVNSYATQTAALGTAIVTVDALNMVLVSVLVFLFMRQVMPIASGLAGGAAFNTFGTVSRAVNWGTRTGMGAVLRGARTAVALWRRDRV
jgi:type IV secretion system protein VirB6